MCQPPAPELTGRDANKGENGGGNVKGGGEAQAAARKTERGRGTTHDASVNGDNGDGERQGQVVRDQGDGDATGGQRGDRGRRARI